MFWRESINTALPKQFLCPENNSVKKFFLRRIHLFLNLLSILSEKLRNFKLKFCGKDVKFPLCVSRETTGEKILRKVLQFEMIFQMWGQIVFENCPIKARITRLRFTCPKKLGFKTKLDQRYTQVDPCDLIRSIPIIATKKQAKYQTRKIRVCWNNLSKSVFLSNLETHQERENHCRKHLYAAGLALFSKNYKTEKNTLSTTESDQPLPRTFKFEQTKFVLHVF